MQHQLKGLNAIRTLAVTPVLISHIGLFLDYFGLQKRHGLMMAQYGVTIFFALSGFLITYLMLVEKDRQEIDIRAFYIRRVLRIWPLYFFYLSLALLAMYLFDREVLGVSIWYWILMSVNVLHVVIDFFGGRSHLTLGHYWSLGVEEQFYLFWPWIVKRGKAVIPWSIAFILLFIGLKYHYRSIAEAGGSQLPLKAFYTMRFDSMLIGALGAYAFHKKTPLLLWLAKTRLTQLGIVGILIALVLNRYTLIGIIDDEIIATMTVCLILNLCDNPRNMIRIDNPLTDYIGKISFGIYMYHPLVIYLFMKLAGPLIVSLPVAAKYAIIYGGIALVSVGAAAISYRYFEKPFLRLKDKLGDAAPGLRPGWLKAGSRG